MRLTPYREVAKSALMAWNGMSEEEALEVVSTQSFDELEGQIYAKDSMTAAINSISRQLGFTPKQQKKFENSVLSQDVYLASEDEELFTAIQKGIAGMDLASINIDALSDIHDSWVKSNAGKFSKPGRENKRFQHAPTQLIGWKETKADLIFLEPIMEAIGGKVDELNLQACYEDWSKDYLIEHKLIDAEGHILKENLEEFIAGGSENYSALTDGVNTTTDGAVISNMVDQISDKIQKTLEQGSRER